MRIIKLGGSLLTCPALAATLRSWLSQQPGMVNLILAGGGRLADLVREADAMYRLDPETAHWLAIRTMGMHAQIVAALLPEASLLSSLSEMAAQRDHGGLAVVDPWHFLREEEPHCEGTRLPVGWHVTSDSIAARLAVVLRADELALLKSTLPPPGTDRRNAARESYVDDYFSCAAAGLTQVRCVNLRETSFPQVYL